MLCGRELLTVLFPSGIWSFRNSCSSTAVFQTVRYKGAERVLGQVGSRQRFMSVMRVLKRPSWHDRCSVPSESLLCLHKMGKINYQWSLLPRLPDLWRKKELNHLLLIVLNILICFPIKVPVLSVLSCLHLALFSFENYFYICPRVERLLQCALSRATSTGNLAARARAVHPAQCSLRACC